MIIGDRLREIREQRNLSQGDMESRTGPLRCYISRVENGHMVPVIETLEKMARALEVPMYVLFYEGKRPPVAAHPCSRGTGKSQWGSSGKERDRKLILALAHKMALAHKTGSRRLALSDLTVAPVNAHQNKGCRFRTVTSVRL